MDSLPVRPGHNFVREQMKRVFFNQQLVTENAIDEIAEILSDRGRQINLIHAARSAKKDYMFDELPAIKCPSLLLWGENDEVTTLTVAKTFNERIPNSKLITIAGCGHAPMIEHPKWFADHIKSFLQTNKLL